MNIYIQTPLIASLMLDKFKAYLNDSNFVDIERQIALMKFLDNCYPKEVNDDVVEFVSHCELYNDYVKILLEWNYKYSDYLKREALSRYDGDLLCCDEATNKSRKYFNKFIDDDVNSFINDIIYGHEHYSAND